MTVRRFEYSFHCIRIDILQGYLSEFGLYGWELVHCDRVVTRHETDPGTDVHYHVILKRRIEQ